MVTKADKVKEEVWRLFEYQHYYPISKGAIEVLIEYIDNGSVKINDIGDILFECTELAQEVRQRRITEYNMYLTLEKIKNDIRPQKRTPNDLIDYTTSVLIQISRQTSRKYKTLTPSVFINELISLTPLIRYEMQSKGYEERDIEDVLARILNLYSRKFLMGYTR